MAPRNVWRCGMLLGLAWMAVPATTLADEKVKRPGTAAEIRAALDQKKSLDFSSDHLDEALNHLQEKTKINFVLDNMVLQQLGIGPPNEMPSTARLKTDGGRIRSALQRMLEPYHLTYVILGDRVLVTTDDVAHYRRLRQRVSVDANAVPLGEALQKLGQQTAVNIVIDPRVAKQVKTAVTLEQDDITLETAVRLLTFMADLRAVAVGNVLLVTTEERAEKLMRQGDSPRPPLIGGAEMIEVPGPGRVIVPAVPVPQPLPVPVPGGKSSTAVPFGRTEQTAQKCCPVHDRTPIEPPLMAGEKLMCAKPPDRAAILRALPDVAPSVPYLYEVSRDGISVSVEKVMDRVDPARFFPLIGPAQLHHCHWKCLVHYTETVRVRFPVSLEWKRRQREVIYIDKDHLHTLPTTTGVSPEGS